MTVWVLCLWVIFTNPWLLLVHGWVRSGCFSQLLMLFTWTFELSSAAHHLDVQWYFLGVDAPPVWNQAFPLRVGRFILFFFLGSFSQTSVISFWQIILSTAGHNWKSKWKAIGAYRCESQVFQPWLELRTNQITLHNKLLQDPHRMTEVSSRFSMIWISEEHKYSDWDLIRRKILIWRSHYL